MIEMFPSHLEGPSLATYRTQERMTIEAWLLAGYSLEHDSLRSGA